MVSKGMLKVDLIGQALIIAFMLLYIIFTPSSVYLSSLLSLFFLGLWQFANGLIETILYRNKIRQKYIFAASIYIVGLIILTSMNNFYTSKVSGFMEIFSVFYFIIGSLGFASWYFVQTYKDFGSPKYRHPRSFWDYEF